MENYLTSEDWGRADLQGIIDRAKAFRDSPLSSDLANKTIALVFFNPSLRTRTSFDVGARQMGGHAVVLNADGSVWPMEMTDGVVMDGDAEEHVREGARVLSRYCDLIGVRAFPKFKDWSIDREDRVIKAFAAHADVPVINMETIVHPCQELALMMALQDKLGAPDRKKFVLTWTYHPRPLNTAVANSALLIASKFGMDVTVLRPSDEYDLDERFISAAKANAVENGSELTFTDDIDAAYDGAEFVYAKSWGALPYFGRWDEEKPIRDAHKHFIVDEAKMARTNNAYFSHCLPMRRNVKATDAVVDSDRSLIIEEAESRLHVQKALMARLIKGQ